MSATETAPAPAPTERACPRCAAPLRPEQEWCLQCGTGVGARVATPRGWRVPLAVVGGLLGLLLLAALLAIVELAGDAERVGPAAPPVAQATPVPTAVTPAPTATATATPAGQLATWPAGKTGFTIVLDSSSTRSAAEARATELVGQGLAAGVLDSSGYARLTPNRFVVFAGQYATRAEARRALGAVRARVEGARVRRVAPA